MKAIDTGIIAVEPWFDRLVSILEKDPRVTEVDWGSGYQYTTGESSGNSEVLAGEGAPEVGYLNVWSDKEDAPELLDLYKCHAIPVERRARFRVELPDAEAARDLQVRLRADERAFDLKVAGSVVEVSCFDAMAEGLGEVLGPEAIILT